MVEIKMNQLLLCAVLGCLLMQTESMPTMLPADTMLAVNPGTPPGEVTNITTAMYYMKYYNDMDADGTDDDMMDSLKDFQRMANLPETGELDNATLVMMNLARCGVKDNLGITTKERKRAKRFAAVIRWPEDEITWRLNSGSRNLVRTDVQAIMRRALQVWAEHGNIRFTEVQNPNVLVDFNVEFYLGGAFHQQPPATFDGPFDGPRGVLAHAFLPNGSPLESIAGDAHFDDDERFTDETNTGINLFQVAAHEFGHSLGLGHSTNPDALMAAFYRGYQPNFQLHPDDIAGIQYLYGENVGRPDVTMPPMTQAPAAPGGQPGACPGFNLDAIVRTSTDGETIQTYFLKDDLVWTITAQGPSGPQPVGNVFRNFPNNVDAGLYIPAYSTPDSGRTYFFKGSSYYEYIGNTLVGGPQAISVGFPGLPNDIDTAFVWSGNGRPYFTKGNMYYRFNPYQRRVDSKYPRPLSDWSLKDADNQPLTRLDAAFQWDNRRTYFFYENQYLRYDDANFRVDQSTPNDPYPRNIGRFFFGCQSNAELTGNNADGGALNTVLPSIVLVALSAFLTFTLKFE